MVFAALVGCAQDGGRSRAPLGDAGDGADAALTHDAGDGAGDGDVGDGDAGGDADVPDATVCGPEVCNELDDDCDGEVDEGLLLDCRFDVDRDGHSVSPDTVPMCSDGGVCPAGWVSVAADLGTDCDDSNPAIHTGVAVRTDADGDGYCVGLTATACLGAGGLPGDRRRASECAASDDCRDSNVYATTSCLLQGGFSSETLTKACGVGGPPDETRFAWPVTICPAGFQMSPAFPVVVGAGVSCVVQSATTSGATLRQICNEPFASATCRAVADCSAL